MKATEKTLNEQVNEIKNNSTMTANQKKAAYIKLGITSYEADLLLSQDINIAGPFNFTFGVEIECGFSHDLFTIAAQRNSLNTRYEGYNHNDGHNYYKVVRDGSVNVNGQCDEVVSPILNGNSGFESLKAVCKTLADAQAATNRTCGLHVHIGTKSNKGIKHRTYCNVFNNYKYLEPLIDSFMPASRRNDENGYCGSLQRFDFSSCNTAEDVARTLHHDRYFKVNPMSWQRHRTIEFRHHSGTTNYDKISNWVKFCAKLVAWSRKHRLSGYVANIDDVKFLNAEEKAFFKARQASFATA